MRRPRAGGSRAPSPAGRRWSVAARRGWPGYGRRRPRSRACAGRRPGPRPGSGRRRPRSAGHWRWSWPGDRRELGQRAPPVRELGQGGVGGLQVEQTQLGGRVGFHVGRLFSKGGARCVQLPRVGDRADTSTSTVVPNRPRTGRRLPATAPRSPSGRRRAAPWPRAGAPGPPPGRMVLEIGGEKDVGAGSPREARCRPRPSRRTRQPARPSRSGSPAARTPQTVRRQGRRGHGR